MAKIFEKLGMTKPPMSAFDLSHEKKMSIKFAELVPAYIQEVLPSDNFKVDTELMLRMAPMIAPIMHRLNVRMEYFFVPNRIIWPEFEDWATGGKDGTSAPTVPFSTSKITKGNLGDYLGLPLMDGAAEPFKYSLLPFRAYQQIFNDYYRDENLSDPVDITNDSAVRGIRTRCWEKDYFTSALPFAQRGPEVSLPTTPNYKNVSDYYRSSTGLEMIDGAASFDSPAAGVSQLEDTAGNPSRVENLDDTDPINISINDLRTSSALQRWLEKQARGGYRYIETVLSHFKQKSSDSRLDRAEYLGGGKQPVVVSEVLNNTGNVGELPQGTMAGHGISVGQTNSFQKTFEEHGYVIGMLSVLPRTAYQQGVPRMFKKFLKEDLYWPDFANLGEQTILNEEIFFDPATNDTLGQDTFGYQQRYAEYKHAQDSVHGEFRDTLDFWHEGRIFAAAPALNDAFVTADVSDRIFAVQAAEQFYCSVYNKVRARRPIPFFANPSLR